MVVPPGTAQFPGNGGREEGETISGTLLWCCEMEKMEREDLKLTYLFPWCAWLLQGMPAGVCC